MERFCLGILTAALASLWLPAVPNPLWPLLLLLSGVLLRRFYLVGISAFLLSLSLNYQLDAQARQQLLVEHTTFVAGTIVSIPQSYDIGSRFILQLHETVKHKPQLAAGRLLQIRWPQTAISPKQGQRWQFQLKLRPVRGLANPGRGISEANALVQGVLLQGAVVGAGEVGSAEYLGGTAVWRQQVYDTLQQQLADLPTMPLLIALTVGERPFSDDTWDGLQATGLAHLISISGMHIALVFGWLMLLMPLWRQLPLSAKQRQVLGWLTALLAAWLYCLLAGWAIPTLRAMLALVILVALKLWHRRCSGWRFSLVLTAGLLLWQPFWLLSLSFWLSVSALALVFLLAWRYPPLLPGNHTTVGWWQSLIWPFLRYQLLFSLLMLPLGLLIFDGVAPLALISNLLFVPWCSLVAIPLLLIVFLLQQLSTVPLVWLWQGIDWIYQPLWWWLQYAATHDAWWSLPQQTPYIAILLVVTASCCLLPKRRLGWTLAAIGSVPLVLVLWLPISPKLHLIDVGQGTAVVLQQGQHGFVYDLGPRYGSYSATKQQLLPFLRYAGIRQLDYVVVSHDDSDHTGDPSVLKAAYPQAQWVSDVARLHPALNCRQLPGQWQQFRLQQLWPANDGVARSKNDGSCVLLVSTGTMQILLTGDASKEVEQQLLKLYPVLNVDVLLLGHHGSQTSSSLRFLQQLQPSLALNSAGWQNPYRHPATDVVATLGLLQIPLWNTAEYGAITLTFSDQQLILQSVRHGRLVKWLENLPTHAETRTTTR
ncbi:DNA internalization-related competence protein ComEC/Rec2 [Rheinheimera riviphila]|uniref:DNA internalization-related competence protein ComEC/Rec2 n=1 Tax=Rheinheimera riviphila TaxID=1834037 RepID=A0A437R2U7_9GAMM|nr:DNA internalization-related competence protein ComEC/Rec2 [Rheinheimera riviphila]RVU41104.1 DNA internalization-related competence protein ComEC/Rec2 [Rheinheimera riviphila]